LCVPSRSAAHRSRKPHLPQIVFERSQCFVVVPLSHGKRERSHGSARSSATKRIIDELSSREKRQVADELMLPTSFLRGGAHGGGLLLAFLLGPFSSSLSEPVRSGAQNDARATSSLPENGG
jgi:hypothetical protein